MLETTTNVFRVLELFKQVVDQEKPKGEKKKKTTEFLSKHENKIDEIISLLRKEWRDFEELFKELDIILETTESEQNEDDTEKRTISEMFTEMKIYQRINAYFVIALYAIIDLYCLSFFQDSLANCSKELLYDSLKKVRFTPSNPLESLNKGLEIQKTETINLKEIREKLIKKLKWEIHQDTFNFFKDIRKIPAYQKAFLSLEEIKEKFPKQQIVADKLFRQVVKELDSEILPPIIKQPLLEGIEDLEVGLYFREIGNSCLRYLVLNEAILQYYLYNERFVEETSEIMRERDEN